jgi:four helix bundle protein
MSPSRSSEDVAVWQKAHAWVLAVYKYAARMPKQEVFGLTARLRRAAESVPANVAEGFTRQSRPDKLRLYDISQGSLEECRYYLRLAQDLAYGDASDLQAGLAEISQVLEAYSRKVREAGS